MLRTDKPIYKAILILNLLLITAGVVLSIIDITNTKTNTARIISLIASIICLAFAGFYILRGYSKNAAKYYKVYGILLAVKYAVSILSGSVRSRDAINIIFMSISLVTVLVLVLIRNLGKTTSLALCGLLIIIRVTMLIIKIGNINNLITAFVNIDLACLYGILTYAKYLDKSERGAK